MLSHLYEKKGHMEKEHTKTPRSLANAYLSPVVERLFTWLTVGCVSLIAFEAVAVGTAMPTVADKLDGQNLYALAMGIPLAAQLVTTALAGLWCDARSSQACLLVGLGVLSAGLTVCTAAPTMELFVVGRTVQGLGGGMCIVPLYSILGSHVRPDRQGRIFAMISGAWILPSMVGPVVAGWMVESLNWRAVFGCVPVLFLLGLPLLLVVLKRLPKTDPGPLVGWTGIMIPSVLTGASIAGLQILSGTPPEKFTGAVYAAVVLTGVLTFVFIRPLLPRGTYVARRGLASTILMRGLSSGTLLGTEAFLPLLLQKIHGWRPTEAGFILTVGSITWALGSWIQGRISSPDLRRNIASLGTTFQLCGILVVVPASFYRFSPWLVVAGWSLAGLGMGLVFSAMAVHALAMTPKRRQGTTSSAIQLADTLGFSFCVAVVGLVYAIVMPAQEWAFAASVGTMALLSAVSLIVVRRTVPHPGSEEEAQLQSSARAIESVV
mgnify:FL=1